MIHLDYEYGFVVYLFTWFVFLVIVWIRELWRAKAHEWTLSEGRLCICDDCHFAFLIKPGETAARCPRCDEICVIRKKKRKR